MLASCGMLATENGTFSPFRADCVRARALATSGFYLAREYWGRGIATEAGRAFIEFGFTQLHLRRIVAAVKVGNAASVSVLQKLGFVLVQTERGVRSFHHHELPHGSAKRT
jgi:ribosomal-protein-alanine N-acetyltransferase